MSYFSLVSETVRCICAGMTRRKSLLRWMSLKKETSSISTTSTGFVVEKTNFIGIISGKEIFLMKIIDAKESPPNPSCLSWFPVQNSNGENRIFMSKEVIMAPPIYPLCLIKQLADALAYFLNVFAHFITTSEQCHHRNSVQFNFQTSKYQIDCQRNGMWLLIHLQYSACELYGFIFHLLCATMPASKKNFTLLYQFFDIIHNNFNNILL